MKLVNDFLWQVTTARNEHLLLAMFGGDRKQTLKIFSEEADFSEKAFKLVLMSLLESGAEIAFITP